MAYNFHIESNESFDWQEINKLYKSVDSAFSLFPIITALDENGLGLSIPTEQFSILVWKQTANFLKSLSERYSIKVFDLYEGIEVDISNYIPSGL